MIARGCFIFTILATCVVSWPVPESRLENEDVKVMKCIVEALADVLSRPQNLPVRQECVDTLRRDERLVSILRHHNFLKELQNIALQGPNGNTEQQSDITADHVTRTPQPTEDVADRSMLEALGGPGERSILADKRTTAGGREEESTEKNEESQEGNEIRRDEEESDEDEKPDNRISDSMNEEENRENGELVEKKREDEGKEEDDEEEGLELKRQTSEEDSEEDRSQEDDVKQDHKGAASTEKQDAAEKKSVTSAEEEEKRSRMFLSDGTESEKKGDREAEEEEEEESADDSKHWSRKSELAPMKKRPEEEEGPEVRSLEVRDPQEVPHHSKEVVGEEGEEKEQRSPEVKELQMMARRIPTEKGAEEEEGSAIRKTEDPEIASLAALESELENVAQKLHELRQG
ncbi:chromogranin-A [Osmerus eperlanus]|uniref:chromogranin-A n=1 Tax=Osmerus eperlanus TaxID=29151 RepID=UPI002E0EC64D